MKKLLLCSLLLTITGVIYGQTPENIRTKYAGDEANLVKVNLFALPLSNFSFQYERKIGRKTTAALGFRLMPESGFPKTITSLIDDPETEDQLDQFKTGNTAVTPEIRFYLGKQAMRGFYLAPFARFSKYTAEGPFEFDVSGNTEVIPLEGKLNTVTAGLLIGAQWKLGGRVYLDWWMLGPQYGSAKGNLVGTKSLSPVEQDELREELQDIEIPFADTETSVNANGARLDIKGPWAGVRAGLCLGIRF